MSRSARRYSPPGTPPGNIIPAESPSEEVKLTLISYSPDEYEEVEAESLDQCFEYVGKRDVVWINIEGKNDIELLKKTEEQFGFHPLTLEDTTYSDQRPKVEDFGDYIFIIVRLPQKPGVRSPVSVEQISIFLGPNFVVTIQDMGDDLEHVRQRIKDDRGRIRKAKAGYLAYALIDLVIDQYFPVLESIGDQTELMEDEVQKSASPEIVNKIRQVKRDLLLVRNSIWPMREVISELQREEPKLIAEATKLYLRNAYEHTIQIADMVESYRDILSEMFNVYLSVTANSTNEVMKILTIFATIFIPLTFVVGIYGMNFEFMPELRWRPAYFILLGLMAVIALTMVRFFKKRGWF
jgi:magnesium transporter